MPIKATFAADFSKFNAAVDQATVALKDFESGAQKVDKSLSRFGDQFSGRRILQEATLAAKAVEAVGGVTSLTEKEQRALNATLTEAIAKYKALGVEAPKAVLDLEAATRRVEAVTKQATTATSGLSRGMVAVGSAIGSFAGALASQAFAQGVQYLKDAAAAGAQFSQLAPGFDRLAKSVGSTGEAMLHAQRTATKGLISDLSLMQATNKAVLLGLPVTAEEMGNLAKTATTLGRAMGQDATKSLDDLITALGRSSPMILDNLGLTVKVGEANEKYAQQLGKTATELTEAEQKQAFFNAAMDAARTKTAELGEVQLGVTDQLSRLGTTVANLVTRMVAAGNESTTFAGTLGSLADKAAEAEDRLLSLQRARALVAKDPKTALGGSLEDLEAYIDGLAEADRINRRRRSDVELVDPAAAAGAAAAAQTARQTLEAQRAAQQKAAAAERERVEQAAALVRTHAQIQDYIAAQGDEMRRLAAASHDVAVQMGGISAAAAAMPEPGRYLDPAVQALQGTNLKTAAGAGQAQDAFFGAFQQYAQQVPEQMAAPAKAAGNAFTRAFTSSLQNVGPSIVAALQGGGNVAKSVASSVGLGITEKMFAADSGLMKGITGKLSGVFGKTIGGALAGMLPGIGALAGPAIEGITKLFGKMFGGEGKQTNKQRDEWIRANFGTSDNLRKLATEAGVADSELRKLFSVSKVKDFEAASAAVAAKLGTFTAEQEADAARLEAAINKYGFSLEQLGPKLQQSKLDEQAKELIEDWRVLVDAGIDVAQVNENMAETINEYLQNAVKLGTEVPRAMKPILERMAEQGTLTDSAGNKIEDLESLGLQYSETMSQGFDRVVTKLEELIGKIGGVGTELDAIPDEKVIDVIVRYHEEGRPENLSEEVHRPFESYLNEPNLPGFQTGTRGRYLDFGEGTPVMLHGKERIVTEDEQSVASAQMTTMVNAVAALQVSLVRALRENALQVRDQTQLALARA